MLFDLSFSVPKMMDTSDIVTCDICGDDTGDVVRLSEENWEFCSGLDKQFCGKCREKREEPPCDDSDCDADICYNAHHESESE